MKPKKVLVAMSGGVDSSVGALLMKKKGYEVIGAFMKNWSDSKNDLTGECNWKDERKMAMKISSILKIPLITLDFEKEYRKEVVEKMYRDYKKGITPNPDIDCNQKIKFPLLIKTAKKFGADFVVTGHYARIKKSNDIKYVHSALLHSHINDLIDNKSNNKIQVKNDVRWGGRSGVGGGTNYKLLRGRDESKDQSYFLYRLKQSELKHVLFPVGNYTKKEIREIARKNKFPNYNKKSTVGICFIGKVNLKKFLKKKIKEKKGKIISPEGKVIGEHDGIYYYTIGQRLGPRYGFEISRLSQVQSTSSKLGQSKGKNNQIKRWYVAKKDAKNNIIVAAPEGHKLNYRKEVWIKNVHWINKNEIKNLVSMSGWEGTRRRIKILARIRQVGELLPSKIYFSGRKIKVTLNKAITGVSEGQAIVLYQGKKVLGGGEISFK